MRLVQIMKPWTRRAIAGVSLVTRAMTLGVRVIARDEAGRVVLVRHTYLPGWYLPGGGVDPGETLEVAARRELVEETGFAVPGGMRLFNIYLNGRYSPRNHVALYVGEGIEQARAVTIPNREIAEIGVFGPDELPSDTTGATRRRLAELLDGAGPDPHW